MTTIAVHPKVKSVTITRFEGVDVEICRTASDNDKSVIYRNVTVEVHTGSTVTAKTVQIIESTDIMGDGVGKVFAIYINAFYVSINPTCHNTER
jgi:hypothetical protein